MADRPAAIAAAAAVMVLRFVLLIDVLREVHKNCIGNYKFASTASRQQ